MAFLLIFSLHPSPSPSEEFCTTALFKRLNVHPHDLSFSLQKENFLAVIHFRDNFMVEQRNETFHEFSFSYILNLIMRSKSFLSLSLSRNAHSDGNWIGLWLLRPHRHLRAALHVPL